MKSLIPSAPARPRLLAGGAIVLAALAAYHAGFAGPLVLDDLSSIADNPTIRHLWAWPGPWAPPHGGGLTVEGRPVVNLSLALNYAIGGTQVWSYHALNLAIHLLAGLALFGVVRRTLARRPGPATASATPLALAAALLWTLHPVQTESVTYIIQRAESLMGFFYLLTLYGFVRQAGASEAGRAAPAWTAVSILACLAGMATKEVMVSAPLIVLLYDRTFFAGSFRAAWRQRRAYYLALASTWLLLARLAAGAGDRGGTSGFGLKVSAVDYWFSQFPVIVRYLRLAIWPSPLIFDYGPGPLSSTGTAALAAILVAGLVAATGWALWRRPVWGFLGFWFFSLLAPTSLVPGNRQVMAEHRLYLALAPIAVAAAWGAWRLLGRRGLIVLLGAACGLGALTARRNQDYASALALYSDNVSKLPSNPYAQCNLGVALFSAGRLPEAVEHDLAGVRLLPDYAIGHGNLGDAFLKVGRVAEAADQFEQAIRLKPGYAKAYNNLGMAKASLGDLPAAVASFAQAVQLQPDSADYQDNLGNAQLQTGRAPEAAEHYASALRLAPSDPANYANLANALAAQGKTTEAVGYFQEALRLRPNYLEAHYNLGGVLLGLGQLEAARDEFEAAVRLGPDSFPAHYDLGLTLLRLGRGPEAVAELRAALRLQPNSAAARQALDYARAQ